MEVRVVAGDHSGNSIDVQPVATQRSYDRLTQGNSTANDILCRRMVIDVESFLEYGFQGMRERWMSYIVEKSGGAYEAPIWGVKIAITAIEMSQAKDAETVLIASVSGG